MMNKKNTRYLSEKLLLILLIMAGCKAGNEIASVNLAGMYRTENRPEITGVRIFNQTDSVSRAFVRYESASLLYARDNPVESYKANYVISYQLYPSYESNQLLDSASYAFTDSTHYNKDLPVVFDFTVKAPFPGKYLLEVQIEDLNRETSSVYPQYIYKTDRGSAQYFLPLNDNEEVIFEDWVSWKTKFRLLTANMSTNRIYARYYEQKFPVARPPFSMAHPNTYDYTADDYFKVEVVNGHSELMQFGKEGFFHFLTDTTGRQGITLFRFHDDYPQLTDAEQLVPPLRYLTTTPEFDALLGAPNPKAAVDSFWIKTAGNEDRAVQLIKDYYSRVEYANTYFVSYKEGWKTDRGMIYIIFGPPQTVYRRTDIETWIYGEQGNRVSLRFDFIKNINPFTENDYSLQRDSGYKNAWFMAVDYWRR